MNKDVENLLVDIFDGGLDEDTHFRCTKENCENFSIEELEDSLNELKQDSFEYNLLSRLIEDMRWKLEAEKNYKESRKIK